MGRHSGRELREAYNQTLQQAQEAFTYDAAQFRETLSRQSERHTGTQAEQSYGQSYDREKSSQWLRMSAAVDRVSSQLLNRFGYNTEETRQIAEQALFVKSIRAGGGLSASFGKQLGKLGIGFEGSGDLSGRKENEESATVQTRRHEAFDEAYNAFTDQEAREASSLHEQSRSSEQFRHAHTTASGERESTAAGTVRESQRQQGLRDLVTQLESLSTRMSQAEARSVTLNQDQTAALVQYISSQSGKSESQVAAQIGDAVKFNLIDRSGIGEKTVSQWAQEWYERNRPAVEGFPEQGSSLKEIIPSRMNEEKNAMEHKQDEVSSSVQNQQDAIFTEMERGKGLTVTRGQDVTQHVENARRETEAKIDSRKGEISGKKEAIEQTGQEMKNRVEDFQKEEVSLKDTMMEGIKDLNPWRNQSESRLSESCDKLFENTPPNSNFYWEDRMKRLEEMQKGEKRDGG